MDGYGSAFRNAANQNPIINGGGIAVGYVFFSSTVSAGNNWTLLSDVASINAFALTLETVARPNSLGAQTDVSGDGEENVTAAASLHAQRDAAFASGIVINELPIGPVSLATYNTNNVITFAGFESAINQKLFRELGGDVPEPGTYAMMGLGLMGLAYFRRKK